jgi:hypothetical protein
VKGKLKPNYMHVVKHGTMVKLLVQKKKNVDKSIRETIHELIL